MADHNDPNAVNSIFSDIDTSAAEAHLFDRAAMIFKACSGNGVADRYFKLATELNPDYESFHVHR